MLKNARIWDILIAKYEDEDIMQEFLEKKWCRVIFIYILPMFIGLELPIIVDLWRKRGIYFYVALIVGIIMIVFYAYTSYIYVKNEKEEKEEKERLKNEIASLESDIIILEKEKDAFDKGMRELSTLFYDSSTSLNKVSTLILSGNRTLDIWSFKKVATGICNSVYNLLCEVCKPYDDFTVNIMLADPTATKRKQNITMIAHKGKYEKYPGKFEEKLYFEKHDTFYAVKICKSQNKDIRILTTKEEVNESFVYIGEDHPAYSQYIGMPIVCSGNKIICLLQICAFGDNKIADTKTDILKLVTKYLLPFTYYALLTYKVEKGLISSFSVIDKLEKEAQNNEN